MNVHPARLALALATTFLLAAHAEVTRSEGPTSEPICPNQYEEPSQDSERSNTIRTNWSEITSGRLLSRDPFDGNPRQTTRILATNWLSDYWITRCPVYLGESYSHSGKACTKKEIFSRVSKLTINPAKNGGIGRYEVEVTNATIDSQQAKTLEGTFRSVPIRGFNHPIETGWLESENPIDGMDFFIYLQDTRNRRDAPRDYKAFRIEAFPSIGEEVKCDTHRPTVSLCAANDGRHGCSLLHESPAGNSNSHSELRIMEADTGGGHEPPPG